MRLDGLAAQMDSGAMQPQSDFADPSVGPTSTATNALPSASSEVVGSVDRERQHR